MDRVVTLLDILDIIRENNTEKYLGVFDRYYFSNSLSHQLGFCGDGIGYTIGGDLGSIPFIFNRNGISFDEKPYIFDCYGSISGIRNISWSFSKITYFSRDFENFETTFIYKVKNIYGENALDEFNIA